jgi:hypothetical protein
MTHTDATGNTVQHFDFVWFKPEGRGERFERRAHALARRLRIPWVRSTLWERDHPESRFHAVSYGAPWTSTNALTNFSFACTCHKRERYSRKAKRQYKRDRQGGGR